MHPGWLIMAVSVWVSVACNVALWRALAGQGAGLAPALAGSVFTGSAVAMLLSLLGWRRTLKPAASLVMLVFALLACSAWTQSLPFDGSLIAKGPEAMFPTWPSLLSWQVPTLLVVLGLAPLLWVWQTQVRRLPGPQQLASNMAGMATGAVAMAASGVMIASGLTA